LFSFHSVPSNPTTPSLSSFFYSLRSLPSLNQQRVIALFHRFSVTAPPLVFGSTSPTKAKIDPRRPTRTRLTAPKPIPIHHASLVDPDRRGPGGLRRRRR